jgi:hypothetical protein
MRGICIIMNERSELFLFHFLKNRLPEIHIVFCIKNMDFDNIINYQNEAIKEFLSNESLSARKDDILNLYPLLIEDNRLYISDKPKKCWTRNQTPKTNYSFSNQNKRILIRRSNARNK